MDWVKDFHVAASDFVAVTVEVVPIESMDELGDVLAGGGGGLESEEICGRAVEVKEFAVGIGDEDAFKEGIEDGFEETFFAGELGKVILDFVRLEELDFFEELFEEAAFHLWSSGFFKKKKRAD